MTTATFNHAPAGSLRHYFTLVFYAARAFAEALFAAQGRQFVAQQVRTAKSVSDRARAKGRRQLFSLASEHESFSPSLAAELRNIAARD